MEKPEKTAAKGEENSRQAKGREQQKTQRKLILSTHSERLDSMPDDATGEDEMN